MHSNKSCVFLPQFVSDAVDRGCWVDVVYTDFNKAFDYFIFLAKLYGISDVLLRILSSYLLSHSPFEHYSGVGTYTSTSGVFLGTNVGSLLFPIFINTLPAATLNQLFAYLYILI